MCRDILTTFLQFNYGTKIHLIIAQTHCVLGMIFISSDFLFTLISVMNWPYTIFFILISHEILKYFSAVMPSCVNEELNDLYS